MMKLKFLFSILVICLFATASSTRTNAQKKQFDVSISVKDAAFLLLPGDWLVKVKITNLSDKVLNTKDCALLFKFRKTASESESANAIGGYPIEERLIKQNESFEFEANLKNLRWVEPSKSSVFVLERKERPAYKPALSGYYSLTATVTRYEESGSAQSRKVKVFNSTSNALAVKIGLKTDK
jgi:hypothetical protein